MLGSAGKGVAKQGVDPYKYAVPSPHVLARRVISLSVKQYTRDPEHLPVASDLACRLSRSVEVVES